MLALTAVNEIKLIETGTQLLTSLVFCTAPCGS